MKKIMMSLAAFMFVLALGVAHADEMGYVSYNGITIFTAPAVSGMHSIEPSMAFENGITNFAGRSNDTLSDLGVSPAVESPVMFGEYVTGANAGGLRWEAPVKKSYNGITIFNGASHDTL